MKVATQTFSTEYDGQLIEIVAGKSHLHPDHEVVKNHPTAFREAGSRTARARADVMHESVGRVAWQQQPEKQRTALYTGRSSRPRGGQLSTPSRDVEAERRQLALEREARKVRLEQTPSPHRVQIASPALIDLTNTICGAMQQRARLEIGCAVFGRRAADQSTIYISRCGYVGPNSKRYPDRFIRDVAFDSQEALRLKRDGDGYVELGFAHSHVNGDSQPSAADLVHWRNGAEMFGVRYVGLIATAARRDWEAIDLHAYVVRPVVVRGIRIGHVIEPACIIS